MKDIIAGWKCDIDNYFESLENAKEIRFWISNTVNNIVGLEITCTILKEQIPTYFCFLPRLDLTDLNIDIFSDLFFEMQCVSHALLLCTQIAFVISIGLNFDGHVFNDFQAIGFKADALDGVV